MGVIPPAAQGDARLLTDDGIPAEDLAAQLSLSLGSWVTHIPITQCLGEQRGQWGLSEMGRKNCGHLVLQKRA